VVAQKFIYEYTKDQIVSRECDLGVLMDSRVDLGTFYFEFEVNIYTSM
jgi:hypothetical protein